MDWSSVWNILQDLGLQPGVIIIILILIWIWRRFETIDRRFETIDRRFEAIDRRFETIDRRFDELKTYVDRRFARIEMGFLAYAQGNLQFQKSLLKTLVRNGAIRSESVFESLEAGMSLSHLEDFFSSPINPVTAFEKQRLREYTYKILRKERLSKEEAKEFDEIVKKCEREHIDKYAVWILSIMSVYITVLASMENEAQK